MNLGCTELLLLVADVDGVESNVSHFVVTTTGPDVEFLDDASCCWCWCVVEKWPLFEECPLECLGFCSWTGASLCPLKCLCWTCIGVWTPLLAGMEFLIFNISSVSTYFCTLFTYNFIIHTQIDISKCNITIHQDEHGYCKCKSTCIFLCNLTSPSAMIPSNLSNWFINSSIRLSISVSATLPPLVIIDSRADTCQRIKYH